MPSSNRDLLKTFPWGDTALGGQEHWPVEMRSVVQAIMDSDFPVCTGWGEDIIQIYNDSYNQIFGDKHPSSFGSPLRESWPEIWPFVSEALAQVTRTGKPLVFRDTMLPLAKTGVPQECYLDFSYSVVKALDGRILGLMSIATETTDAVVARRRQGVARIRADVAAGRGIAAVSKDLFDLLKSNAMDCRSGVLFRLSPENGIPTEAEWSIRAEPAFVDAVRPVVAAALASPHDTLVPLPEGCLNGDCADQACVLPVADSKGRLIAALVLVPDRLVPLRESFLPYAAQISQQVHSVLHATELKEKEVLRAQEGMAEKSAMYQFLFENIRDGAIYTATGGQPDDDEVVLAINRRASELLGYEPHEVIGMSRVNFFFPDNPALENALRMRADKGFFVGDLTFRGKDGQPVPVEVTSNIFELREGETRSVTILRDISARQARDRERESRMRTEVVASLTRAVAHDFNNLLTVILGSLDELEDRQTNDADRKLLESAVRAAEEAGKLTSQLLTFSGRKATMPRKLDVAAHLQEIRPLLTSALGERNRLILELDTVTMPCWVEPSVLTSALINLATNARHAMSDGGTLRITADLIAPEALPESHDGHGLSLPEYLVLRLRDDGSGVAHDICARVFEPFFTTKGIGDGTGLGLPSVLNALRENGGDLRLAGSGSGAGFRGSGAEFLVILPLASQADAGQPESGTDWPVDGMVVLYVEDNALVREQTVLMLEQLGFAPLVARHGREALDHAMTDARIDIVLTDLVMPGGVSGRALARELARIRPAVPVLITTGYDPEEFPGESDSEHVLRKPYLKSELATALFNAMKQHHSAPKSAGQPNVTRP